MNSRGAGAPTSAACKAPWHSSVTGGKSSLPPSLVLAVFEVMSRRSLGPVRVGHSVSFRGAPPSVVRVARRGLTGWLLGVPPALDRSPCGQVYAPWPKASWVQTMAGGIRGSWRLWQRGIHRAEFGIQVSLTGPFKPVFPETSVRGASTPADPSSPRLCGGLSFLN